MSLNQYDTAERQMIEIGETLLFALLLSTVWLLTAQQERHDKIASYCVHKEQASVPIICLLIA